MKKIALTAALAGLLLFSNTALADEEQQHDGHSGGHGTTQVQPTETQTPEATDAHSHNMSTQEHQNMNMDTETEAEAETENGAHSHGNVNVVETPPNLPVLGTFAAINAVFVLIGIWNKWFGKKGGAVA